MDPYYRDALITIYHGDCREVMPELSAVDHVITDPPYSEHVHAKQWIGAALTSEGKPRVSTAHKELGFEAMTDALAKAIAAEWRRMCARWILVFCDLESISVWRETILLADLEYVRAMIWDRVDSAPQFSGDRPAASADAIVCAHRPGRKAWNGGGARNVLRHAANAVRGAKPHPTTKPEPLMLELVELFTDPGEIVLDPFAGSGSTLVACKRLGRHAIGIERNERWCEEAARRCAQGTLDLFEPAAEQSPLELF